MAEPARATGSLAGPGRIRLLQTVMLVAFVLLALQLARMQLLDPAGYGEIPDSSRVRILRTEPPRGLIYDRNGVLLARNVPAFSVVVVPADLPTDEAQRRSVLLALERETGSAYRDIEQIVNRGLESVDPFAPVTVRVGIDPTDAIVARAALAALPGVHVQATPERRYEGGDLLAHILGFVGPIAPEDVDGYLDTGYPLNAQVGHSGVEIVYESALRGSQGRRLVLSDPTGRELELLGSLAPSPGADLTLSIDLDLQAAVAQTLEDGLRAGLAEPLARDLTGTRQPLASGAAVVLDVRSGELLALVSLPSFEVNTFTGLRDAEELERLFTDPARPLIHRAYMEIRSPGSTFKPLVALAALQEGVATPQTRITSTGAITVVDEYNPQVRYVFRDWMAHGTLDLYGGIARSSDVYFYYLSGGYSWNGEQLFEGLGADRIAEYARASGLGQRTGLDLPGEASGLVPDRSWKEEVIGEPWVLGDTYTYGIGQGYLTVTPLQMAVLTAAIANGGDVLVPRVVSAVTEQGSTRPTPRVTTGRLPVDAEHIQVVREALRLAAAPGGTAENGRPPSLTIGGKTGTAEFGTPYADGSFDTHGWYIGFAPYDEPEIAVVVYLEHGNGSRNAAPVARAIFEAYFGLEASTVAAP